MEIMLEGSRQSLKRQTSAQYNNILVLSGSRVMQTKTKKIQLFNLAPQIVSSGHA